MERPYGVLGSGSERAGSSRKGKKSNSDKPKQPQRGLGVAQLEKIRIHSQMVGYLPSLHSPSHSNNLNQEDMGSEMARSQTYYATSMMESGEDGRPDAGYTELIQSSSSTSSPSNHNAFLRQALAEGTVKTLPLLEDSMEDSLGKKTVQDRSSGSTSHTSESSDTRELGLDLKLSL